MLILGSKLINTPIMSLQTGSELGKVTLPVIDPETLSIAAYEVQGNNLSYNPSLLRIADIRELSNVGMIVDSSDELVGPDEIIILKKIHELDFKLINMKVVSESGKHLGTVDDYVINDQTFVIQQINIKHGILKSFGDTGRLISRSQIAEINNKNIVVKDALGKIEPIKELSQSSFVNPFRSENPQAEARDSD